MEIEDKVESKRLEDSTSAMLIEVNKDRSVKMSNEQVETITEILKKARERGGNDTDDLMIEWAIERWRTYVHTR